MVSMRNDLGVTHPVRLRENLYTIINRKAERYGGGLGSILEAGRDRFERFAVNGGRSVFV